MIIEYYPQRSELGLGPWKVIEHINDKNATSNRVLAFDLDKLDAFQIAAAMNEKFGVPKIKNVET